MIIKVLIVILNKDTSIFIKPRGNIPTQKRDGNGMNRRCKRKIRVNRKSEILRNKGKYKI